MDLIGGSNQELKFGINHHLPKVQAIYHIFTWDIGSQQIFFLTTSLASSKSHLGQGYQNAHVRCDGATAKTDADGCDDCRNDDDDDDDEDDDDHDEEEEEEHDAACDCVLEDWKHCPQHAPQSDPAFLSARGQLSLPINLHARSHMMFWIFLNLAMHIYIYIYIYVYLYLYVYVYII